MIVSALVSLLIELGEASHHSWQNWGKFCILKWDQGCRNVFSLLVIHPEHDKDGYTLEADVLFWFSSLAEVKCDYFMLWSNKWVWLLTCFFNDNRWYKLLFMLLLVTTMLRLLKFCLIGRVWRRLSWKPRIWYELHFDDLSRSAKIAVSIKFFLFWHKSVYLQYGETPLHMAAKNGCNDAAKLLLSHGAYIEAKANVIFVLFSPFFFMVHIQ